MPKVIEVQTAKELADTFLPDIFFKMAVNSVLDAAPAADAIPVDVVAEMLAELFCDGCACNYCGIDEWLPEKCKYTHGEKFSCPYPDDKLGCWKQFIEHWEERNNL